MKLCVNSQTPLLNFTEPTPDFSQLAKEGIIDVRSLIEGVDFEFSPGGVTRMVLPLLTNMLRRGIMSGAHWVCLNPGAPTRVRMDGITIHHVSLKRERSIGYRLAKEIIWRVFHGLGKTVEQNELLWADDFVDYTYYNRISAESIRSLDAKEDFDLFYIHDFQQLPVGHMLHTLKPKVFRWHIPFEISTIPHEWSGFLSKYLNSYDAIVVSCRRYLDTLRWLGYQGESFYIYPYVDQTVYAKPPPEDLTELKARLSISDGDKLVLLVARLDQTKGQDLAIEAISKVLHEIRNVKLILVGNGSFSGSKLGQGQSKSEKWLLELSNLAKSLQIQNRVVFAGYLPQRLLNAAYECCDMTLLPSRQEGFGLVVVESWLYKKPTIVSVRAGIAELVEDGTNGLLVDPVNSADLAEKMLAIMSNDALAESLGENGFLTSRKCLIDEGLRAESEIMEKLV